MSIRAIHAIFECDGCACQFGAEIDTATKRPLRWSLMDIAEDALRGGQGWVAHGARDREVGFVSCQAGKHLCPTCTKEKDAEHDESCLCDECAPLPVNRPAVGMPVRADTAARLGLRQPGESVQAYMMRKGIRA
jgi:hypothetical protein